MVAQGFRQKLLGFLRSDWTEVGTSAVNSALTLTHTGIVGKIHFVQGFEVVVTGSVTSGDTTIEVREGATVRWRTAIGDSSARGDRVGIMFPRPLQLFSGADAVLSIASGGVGVQMIGNLIGYTT